MDRLETKLIANGGDIAVLVWDSSRTVKLNVTVTEEALDDYADPRGFEGSSDAKFHFALDAIIEAVDQMHERRPNEVTLVIRSADLNRN